MKFFDEIKLASSDEQFWNLVFQWTIKELKITNKKDSKEKKILSEEYGQISKRADESLFQESLSIRNNLLSRHLALMLISDEGELNIDILPEIINELKKHHYDLGPKRQFDAIRHTHILNVLNLIKEDRSIQRLLKLITKPYANKQADMLIRQTLQLTAHQMITDADVRRAVLSAWLCYLRQSVGSCFATAPAIIVQKEQPEQFLKDMNELLSTGRIKRIFGGIEYVVPLCHSSGAGDLRRPISLNNKIENLGLSPGLLYAFETLNFIDKEKNIKERILEAKDLIVQTIGKIQSQSNSGWINAEDILKTFLMGKNNITPQNLLDYDNRSRGLLQTNLMMSFPPIGSGMGGKGEACATFYTQFAQAKEAFKSLSDNALLKTWEFTLASFAETKPSFTRWNMYASLGFNSEEPNGIAAYLYEIIKQKLDRANTKVQDIQLEYEQVYHQLKNVESRYRSANSEKEARWLRMEFEAKKNEFRTLEEIRNQENFKAKRFANLLNDLLNAYDDLFPKYFQEIYDPDMNELRTNGYDDSPAGFRLLYKHGRTNTSQWTLIYSSQEFIESLSAFFIATEVELAHSTLFEGLQEDLSEIITWLISHIKTDAFLTSALLRMAAAHNVEVHSLEALDKKPWAYISGGTMNNLISCYFRYESKPTEVDRWVENKMELLVFFIDTLKQMPSSTLEIYLESADRHLLMHSPTHAFNLLPHLPLLKQCVISEGFSYTWVRDLLIKPAENFCEYLFMEASEWQFILTKLREKIKLPAFNYEDYGKKNPREFRSKLELYVHDQDLLNDIDSFLFSHLPIFSYSELRNRIEKLLSKMPGLTTAQNEKLTLIANSIADRWNKNIFYVTASQLQALCKAALCLVFKSTSASFDYPLLLSQAAQELGYAMPAPILVADTNWNKDYFAFLINPGTSRLDFWRVDYTGSEGMPMSFWEIWMNGSKKQPKWAIYPKPNEYRAH